MSAQDVEQYEYQLSQVTQALEADPGNKELQSLKAELSDLITLTKSYLTEASKGATPTETSSSRSAFKSTSQPAKTSEKESFKVGDEVMAKWVSGDKEWYPAKVTVVSGTEGKYVYTVQFTQYGTIETLPLGNNIRPLDASRKRAYEDSTPVFTSSTGPERKKKVLEYKEPTIKKPKAPPKAELDAGKKSWQAFANKVGKKKGVRVSGDSMFRTPDLGGRVGVVGSGKGMTKDAGTRGKHVYQLDGERDD
ncbi:hypothetical protein SAICODRAFT_68367 [Saitoella complicata NRRL Y-17804]|uniref:uncharacterized protein n=1 Tax=Saitoella complicata (strain BCRC 22490 / CBS 7301 / JCM 7358 / NBRC 10748 / NRRL Y-17804) TaxID=698492 RepID=UPI000866E5A9|nr:uncharacterized protein SAICODRAFT_68367 [Saitoella complicata NRRL Y-17804]ODQ55951.1 hypothetical protein SAICODRAFT_68367 [Saitoella complicata NRRL Y-17804]